MDTSNSEAQSVGLSDPSLSEARRSKLDAINRLSAIGAQRDLDLPQIVVIGSQSAGKSSLIESISGITLPRATGTCTRCPTECRLINSNNPWQCTISLKFTTDEYGDPLEKVNNIRFGDTIRDRREVEDRLRLAQRAILNPRVDPESFLDDHDVPEKNALAFSANCVSLEITGPDVTDLSFVDLPGLINSVADGGRDSDIEEVQELLSSYIKRSSCIILLTVACESDFETQGAYRLARQHDAEGKRTIGVLTKPDRIPEGEESRWFRLIKNEISALQNGWYCVKQPSSKELDEGISFQEARRRGEDFFTTSPPWSKLEATYKRNLGTKAVTRKLNDFLMAVISKRIPEIMQEIQGILKRTKEELHALPKPRSKDPLMEIMHLISDFSDDLHRQGEGFHAGSGALGPESSLFQPIAKAHTIFRQSIRATAPNFRPFDLNEVSSSPRNSLVFNVQPSSCAVQLPNGSTEAIRDIYEPLFLEPEEAEKVSSLGSVIYSGEVAERVQNETTRELPGYHPFHIVQDLISRSTDNWTAPALFLVDSIHQIVVKHQSKIIEKYFAHYEEGGLRVTVSNIMYEYMQERRDRAVERIQWLLKLETSAFTINKNYFNQYRVKFMEFYRNGDKKHPVSAADLEHNKVRDRNESAVEIMATVRAYFHVAYKRVLDTIPLALDYELVRIDKGNVLEALSMGLKITETDGHKRCQRLLAEPAAVVSLREELERRLQRLSAAQRELIGI